MEINDLKSGSIKDIHIRRVNDFGVISLPDVLSVEEPLEIRISYGTGTGRIQKNISVTMRTPGNDIDLAIGFLFTEGIITSFDDIKSASHIDTGCSMQKQNTIEITLTEGFVPALQGSDRNFYTTSSCGVCGKGSINSIKTVSPFSHLEKSQLELSQAVLCQLPKKLRDAQSGFASTGGIHASGLFTMEGELLILSEDVGRHNALDKLIGQALSAKLLPLNRHILLLSGRASFELIQKAAMAGICVVAALGAPSSLAVELAEEFNIALFGFLKDNRFNIYHQDPKTLKLTTYEN